jgi:hypothetical protein
MQISTLCRRMLVLPLAVVAAGCVGGLGTIGTLGTIAELVGSVGRPGPSPQQVQLTAEVRQVDVRRQMIQVEATDGRAGGVLFDLSTTVMHAARPYPINALQQGDVVSLLLEEAPQNNLYARRIEVVRLAQPEIAPAAAAAPAPADTIAVGAEPEPDVTPEVRVFEGEVGAIDAERGTFQLHTPDRGTITVTLPFNPPPATANWFRGLSSGDRVRVEGRPLSGSRVELTGYGEASQS